MPSSSTDIREPLADQIRVDSDALVVELTDGRTLHVPLSWYPRLMHATAEERDNCRLIGRGTGIHWPDIEEDISIRGLIEGRHSAEHPDSLKRWLSSRTDTARSIIAEPDPE